MANWSNPTKDSLYLDFINEVKNRDVDAITLCVADPTNKPTGTIRYNRGTNLFEEWNGAAWVTLVLAVAGGGTGGATQAAARAGLGLGTLATQNANAVAITAGTIAGLTSFSIACSIAMGNNQYDIGSNAAKVRKVYIGSALVIPVGTDMYATS